MKSGMCNLYPRLSAFICGFIFSVLVSRCPAVAAPALQVEAGWSGYARQGRWAPVRVTITKVTAPIVLYDADATTGWRFPWDIPVEDYLFGFALLTLTMLLWDTAAPKQRDVAGATATKVTVSSQPREPAKGTPS